MFASLAELAESTAAANPRKEKHRIQQRDQRRANPEANRARVAQWRRDNPEKYAAAQKRRRERYPGYRNELARKQKERIAGRPRPETCEVCERPPGVKGLHFDHDHATGQFRGWLCSGCNQALGNIRDDLAVLEKLAAYLRR